MKRGADQAMHACGRPRVLLGAAFAILLAVTGCAEPAFDASELIEVWGVTRSSDDGEYTINRVEDPVIRVVYRSSLDPDRFGARLNGEDVTDAFAPVPGKVQQVELPQLTYGKHELVFEVRPVDAWRTRQHLFIIERVEELPSYPTLRRPTPGQPPPE